MVGCWHGYLSGARCRLAYGPADAAATHSLASVKSTLVLPFWYRLTQVVPDKGPLNGCVCVCVLYHLLYCVTVKYTALLQMPQYCTIIVVVFLSVLKQLPVFRGPIYKIYYLTIMPKLRSTCDGRLIYKTSYKERKAFLRYDLGTTHLQSCKIVFPRESAYDIPERNLCTSFVTVVSRSYDKLMINRKIFCKSGPTIL